MTCNSRNADWGLEMITGADSSENDSDARRNDVFPVLLPIVLLSLLTIITKDCWANDGWARVAAGGITFEKTNDIRMKQEVLEISTKLIRVSYRFQNLSEKDIHATVAFPMPPYSFNFGASADDINNIPLDSFVAKVDGQVIPIKKDRRAKIDNKDVTKHLQAIGLTDKQIFETFAICEGEFDKYCGVTKDQENALRKIGSWKVFETAYWDQTFLAHKEISVAHEYVPLAGGTVIPLSAVRSGSKDTCEDEGTERAIQKQIDSLTTSGISEWHIALSEVEYILGTGRTWSGPIEDFRLRVIKDSPEQVISLCFPGKPKRIDPKTFEFVKNRYTPQDRLLIRFYNVYPDQ